MSGPLDSIMEYVHRAQLDPLLTTRLATITAVTATTISVQFDGETTASSRAYLRTYGPTLVGDRALMLRAGSTWVGVARVPGRSPDTGWTNLTPLNSWTVYGVGNPSPGYRRLNGVVHLRGVLGATGAGGVAVANLPVGCRPTSGRLIVAAVSAGGAGSFSIETNGDVVHNTGAGVWYSLAGISFPCDD